MAKHPFKYRRKAKDRLIPVEYPASLRPAEELADEVEYIGSSEHKAYPSFAGPSAFRKADATKCPPEWGTKDKTPFDAALKEALRRECVSEQTEAGYPRYVWGYFNDTLCQARLINRSQGWYKAWLIEEVEAPRDPGGKLRRPDQGRSDV